MSIIFGSKNTMFPEPFPHTPQLPEKTAEEKIMDEIAAQNTTMTWVAWKAHVTKVHLHYVLKGRGDEKRKLSDGLKKRIEVALGREF